MAQVGAFVNYNPSVGTPTFSIQALNSSGHVLETHDVIASAPINTTSQQNAGAFRGIVRLQNDIAAFRCTWYSFHCGR